MPLFSAESCSDVFRHVAEWQRMSVQRQPFHKMTQAQAGNTLLPLSHFHRLTEVRLFILPQNVAVLGVDVKVPGAFGTKGMRACSLLVYVYLCS